MREPKTSEFNPDLQASNQDLSNEFIKESKKCYEILRDLNDQGPTYVFELMRDGNSETYFVTLHSKLDFFREKFPEHGIYMLILQDSKGNVLGVRTNSIHFTKYKGDRPNTLMQGGITVGQTGKGLATLIEIAHRDLLQKYANYFKTPVRWKIINGNLQTIRDMRNEDFVNEQVLKKKEDEQKRWTSLYTRLGFEFDQESGDQLDIGFLHFDPKEEASQVRIKRSIFSFRNRDSESINQSEANEPVNFWNTPTLLKVTRNKDRSDQILVSISPSSEGKKAKAKNETGNITSKEEILKRLKAIK